MSGRRLRRPALFRSAGVLALVAAAPAMSADWRFDPQLAFTALYDDNYRLVTSPLPKQGVTTGVLSLAGSFNGRTPTTQITLTPRVRLSATSPNVDQNASDGFFDVNLLHNGQKSNAGLNATYAHQNLFRLYMPNGGIVFDLGSVSTTEALRTVVGRNAQNLLRADPFASWKLTQRTRFALNGYFTDSSYSRNTTDYIDYRNTLGAASVSFDATRRDTIGLSVTGSQFKAANTTATTNTYGVQAEWRRAFSEISRYYFRLGNERSKYNGPIPVNGVRTANSMSGGAGVSWVWQVNGLFLDATRNVYPNSTGSVARQTEVRVRFQHLHSPKIQSWIAFDGVKYDYVGGASRVADGSTYYVANAAVEFRVTETFSVQPSIDLVQQKLNSNATAARSNTIGVTLLYVPGRRGQSAAVRVQQY